MKNAAGENRAAAFKDIATRYFLSGSLRNQPKERPMTLRDLSLAAFGAALCLVFSFAPAFAAPEAGKVVALTPGAFVERAGQRLPLEMKSAVEAGDTLTTDATGRVRVLFSDDSSMSIGPNTTLNLREFTLGGSKPAVKAHLAKGLLRSITGKIVEQNPEGFALTSPEATVGIRGTIITMRSDKGVTTVFVENTTRKVFVNGVNVPSGKKITVPGVSTAPEDIRPEDRREIGRDLAFRGGIGVAAAAPEPGSSGGQKPTDYLLADNALPTPETALGGLSVADLGGSSLSTGAGGLNPAGPLTATASGTLTHSFSGVVPIGGAWTQTGSSYFSFNVNLSTGGVTNGMLGVQLTDGAFGIMQADAFGGFGTANAAGFTINGFTSSVVSAASYPAISGVAIDSTASNIFVDPGADFTLAGSAVTGNYNLTSSAAGTPVLSTGTLNGGTVSHP